MMSNIAIRAANLAKQYRIGSGNKRHDTIRDHLTHGVRSLFGAGDGQKRESTIWSLKDVSFEIHDGEVVGIIGRNGAGKSTLLRILSRITEPTSGYATIRGRVGCLLEVGTGFHAELTGRENVYLNGAILGMKTAEISRKFDEIVAFAEVERFIDTPVKHYSTGMYLRLAFAVAAHLEPEILIVDEVLAVGDARFQKKCINKMQDVGREGRTVLFVSHHMPAITRLCSRAVLLDGGVVLEDGPAPEVVSAYLNSGLGPTASRMWVDTSKAPGQDVARLNAVRVVSVDGLVTEVVDIRQPFKIEMKYRVLKPGYILLPNFQVFTPEGLHIFSSHDTDPAWRMRRRPVGQYVSTLYIPGNLLSDGAIVVGVGLQTLDPSVGQFYVPDAVGFKVIERLDSDGTSARGDFGGHIGGVVRPLLKWTTELQSDAIDALSPDSHQIFPTHHRA